MFIGGSIRAIDSLDLAGKDRRRVCFGCAIQMPRLKLPLEG